MPNSAWFKLYNPVAFAVIFNLQVVVLVLCGLGREALVSTHMGRTYMLLLQVQVHVLSVASLSSPCGGLIIGSSGKLHPNSNDGLLLLIY